MAAVDKEDRQYELKKKKICRFCLSQDPNKLSNIYLRDTRIKSSAPLPIQIMAIASIEVFSNDEMPSYVCSDCTNMFEFSYQFKQMCKKADNFLRQFPLTGKWPLPLDKPILTGTRLFSSHSAATSGKYNKTTQVRIQQSPKTSVQQESYLLPLKILNSSVSTKTVGSTNSAISLQKCEPKTSVMPNAGKSNLDSPMTFLEKIENNDELSLDDIHQLVAAEEIIETDFVNMDDLNIPIQESDASNKPKLLNKSSIRILNKDAEPQKEPRLSLPTVKKDVNGKMAVVAEILKDGEMPEGNSDTNTATPVETNVFPCLYCERTFPLLQLRDIHMRNHLRDRNFKCDYCEKMFLSKYDLQRHSFLHNGEKPYKCSVCDKAFSRSTTLTRHEMTHTDIPKYICIHCERSFLTAEDMERHEKRHKINRPFVCKICNKGFAFKQGVERHEVIHSRQQPYSCQYCDESFSTTSKLSRHLTAHAGQRPYPCKFCKKSYLLSHHLTRHMRSHKNIYDSTNNVLFTCMRCNTSFNTRDELINHSAVHANEMNPSCPLCKDVFGNMTDLTSHIQNHSEGEAYACEFCDLIFLNPDKLKGHTSDEHEQEMEAYYEDDRAQASNQRDADIADDKLQKTVNEFLGDELPSEGNISEHSLTSKIKEEPEKEYSEVNQIVIQSSVGNLTIENKNEDDKSLLIPLKQSKMDLSGKHVIVESKTKPIEEPSILRRKIPNVTRTTITVNDSCQSGNQSLLKSSQNEIVSKTSSSKTPPTKTPPSKRSTKTSTSATSSTEMSKQSNETKVANSLPPTNVIKVEKWAPETSSASTNINKDNLNKKKVKVQKITVTKAQAAAMAKQGRIKIKDGKIILKK